MPPGPAVVRWPGTRYGARQTMVRRPAWMTALAVLCGVMLLVAIGRDLFVATSRDVEVWLGFEVHGPMALATAPLHWAILLVGAWGFWTARPWIVPATAAYLFYAAV